MCGSKYSPARRVLEILDHCFLLIASGVVMVPKISNVHRLWISLGSFWQVACTSREHQGLQQPSPIANVQLSVCHHESLAQLKCSQGLLAACRLVLSCLLIIAECRAGTLFLHLPLLL